jgi:hypothetical protein
LHKSADLFKKSGLKPISVFLYFNDIIDNLKTTECFSKFDAILSKDNKKLWTIVPTPQTKEDTPSSAI